MKTLLTLRQLLESMGGRMIRWLMSFFRAPPLSSIEHPENPFRLLAEKALPHSQRGDAGSLVIHEFFGVDYREVRFILYQVSGEMYQPVFYDAWGEVQFQARFPEGPLVKGPLPRERDRRISFSSTEFITRRVAVLRLAYSLQLLDQELSKDDPQLHQVRKLTQEAR